MRRSVVWWLSIVLSFTLVAAACGDDGDSASDESDTSDASDEGDASGEGDSGGADLPEGNIGEGAEGEQLTDQGEGSETADLDPVYGGEINWALNRDGSGFDTTAAVAPGSIRLINAMADALTSVTDTGDWAPNLAESLVPNDDSTVWTITLRPGIVFHNGEPLDAAAAVESLQGFANAPLTGPVVGRIEEIVVVDDLTYEVRMNAPWGAFPFILSGQAGWVVAPGTVGVNDSFISTGPFQLESWTPGEGARVVRNENYWRDGLPYLDAINFTFVPEQAARRLALEGGDVDGYISPGDADILDFLDDDGIDVWLGESSGNEMAYLLNTNVAPFDDVRVRRALAYATDRQAVISAFRSDLTVAANSPIHPGSQWYVETDYPDFDIAEATRLIDEYEAEVGPVEFSISSEEGSSFREVTELVIAGWQEAGVDVDIVDIAFGQSANTAIADNFEAIAWIQFSDTDPDGFYIWFHSSQSFTNWTNYQSDAIDDALERGRVSTDPAERAEAYADFQRALADEVPVVWVDHFNGIEGVVTRPYVHNVKEGILPGGETAMGLTAGSFHAWEDVWMEPQE